MRLLPHEHNFATVPKIPFVKRGLTMAEDAFPKECECGFRVYNMWEERQAIESSSARVGVALALWAVFAFCITIVVGILWSWSYPA